MAEPTHQLAPGERGRGSIVSVDPVRRYLKEIEAFRELTEKEEADLAIRYRETGDPEAAYRLVTANLRLVVKIAFQFRRNWANLLDLIQEGNIGLLLAVKKFDPFRGVRLPSYATWWIRAYIIKYILDNWKLVKVGTTNVRRKLLFNLSREIRRLEAEGYKPEPKLLAARLGAGESDVLDVQQSMNARDVSMDTPTDGDQARPLHEVLPSPGSGQEADLLEREFKTLMRDKLREFENDLAGKERFILQKRLIAEDPMTLQEIGDIYGVTREAIRQAENRLLKKLREYMARELKDYEGVKFDVNGR